jgi:hypothetical protein
MGYCRRFYKSKTQSEKGGLRMMELGNLAIVCARKKDVSLQIYNGTATVHVGRGTERKVLSSDWNDNEKIRQFVYELNHGEYKDA